MKKLNSIVTGLFLGASILFTSCNFDVKTKVDSPIIRENPDTLNFVAIYYNDNESLKYFADSCEKFSKNMATQHSIPVQTYIVDASKKIQEEKLSQNASDSIIHNVYKKFYEEHGKIDRAIIGLHSDSSASYFAGNKKQRTMFFSNTDERKISKEESSAIAKNDPQSTKFFSDDAFVIYYGCLAGCGENSIAQSHANTYHVKTIAPETVYLGYVCWNGEDIFLPSKTQQSKIGKTSSYRGPNKHIYLLPAQSNTLIDMTSKDVVSVEELEEKGEIHISNEIQLKADKAQSIEEKMACWGFTLLERNKPYSHFMTVKTFEPQYTP